MSSLKLHFLNVGKGNCTVIEFPTDRLGVVDIDDSRIPDKQKWQIEEVYKVSLTDPVDYLTNRFAGRSIFRFILTHPDLDHMSGLHRLLKRKSLFNFWDTDNNKAIDPDSWEGSPYDKEDWDTYQALRRSDSSPTYLRIYRNGTADCCWVQDGITIMSPSKSLVRLANENEEYNHLSYVLRINYAGRRVLIGGDASKEAWEEILEQYGEEGLRADVLLAPHHGSPNNIHEDALRAVAPLLTVVSVAEGVDYDRDFYKTITKNELVLSTKWWGNIEVEIREDGKITYTTQKE